MIFIGVLFGVFVSTMILCFIGVITCAILEEYEKSYPQLYKYRLEISAGIPIILLIITVIITLIINFSK